MPHVACKVCLKEFYVKPNRLDKGWGKYCSKSCNYKAQKTGARVPCATRGKEAYKNVKDRKRSKSGAYFCGKSCQAVWRNSFFSGENHANWRGGQSSYKNVLRRAGVKPECSKCQSIDQRVLAVHYKDRDRSNNSASNLVWLCHNCHFLVHHYKGEAEGYMVPVA